MRPALLGRLGDDLINTQKTKASRCLLMHLCTSIKLHSPSLQFRRPVQYKARGLRSYVKPCTYQNEVWRARLLFRRSGLWNSLPSNNRHYSVVFKRKLKTERFTQEFDRWLLTFSAPGRFGTTALCKFCMYLYLFGRLLRPAAWKRNGSIMTRSTIIPVTCVVHFTTTVAVHFVKLLTSGLLVTF